MGANLDEMIAEATRTLREFDAYTAERFRKDLAGQPFDRRSGKRDFLMRWERDFLLRRAPLVRAIARLSTLKPMRPFKEIVPDENKIRTCVYDFVRVSHVHVTFSNENEQDLGD